MREKSLEFLKKLLTTPSPSGHEAVAQRIWCDYAREVADEVRTDAYGNAVAVLNPDARPRLMIEGHIDEIGMAVSYIDDKGFLYLRKLGGIDTAMVAGKRVRIHTPRGPVAGVVGSTPIHLQEKGKERKVPELHELYVDIGARDGKEAKKRVAVGDPMTFVDDFEMLNKHIAVARGMDNRCGAWVAIETLRLAKAMKPACSVVACSSIQEEQGLLGAQMQVHNVQPDAAIVVDVTFATDTPGMDMKRFGEIKLGDGPAISMGREHHPVLMERIRRVAKRDKIPHQMELFCGFGGTDAMAIHKANGGVPTVGVSIPNRYMHSTVEMVDLRDLENTAKLLAAVAADIKAGEPFAVKV